MQYFSYISYTLALNNKLEKAINEYLQTQERLVINDIDLELFKSSILLKIAELNVGHPRCNSIKCGWWNHGKLFDSPNNDWQLTGFSPVHFFLYASKK